MGQQDRFRRHRDRAPVRSGPPRRRGLPPRLSSPGSFQRSSEALGSSESRCGVPRVCPCVGQRVARSGRRRPGLRPGVTFDEPADPSVPDGSSPVLTGLTARRASPATGLPDTGLPDTGLPGAGPSGTNVMGGGGLGRFRSGLAASRTARLGGGPSGLGSSGASRLGAALGRRRSGAAISAPADASGARISRGPLTPGTPALGAAANRLPIGGVSSRSRPGGVDPFPLLFGSRRASAGPERGRSAGAAVVRKGSTVGRTDSRSGMERRWGCGVGREAGTVSTGTAAGATAWERGRVRTPRLSAAACGDGA